MQSNFLLPQRAIYTGDNLPFLRSMDSETADLIYLDPPFNSGKQWANPVQAAGRRAMAEFKDTWDLSDIHADHEYEMARYFPEAVDLIDAMARVNGESWKAYLIYMGVRLLEMRRVLKPTGSIYYHCDPVMSHGVKLLMDAIFGRANFRNEIVWCYTGPSAIKTGFPRKHDGRFQSEVQQRGQKKGDGRIILFWLFVITSEDLMYTHLSLSHRITICVRLRQKTSQRKIAKELGVSVSTISREIKRCRRQYNPEVAHHRAKVRRRRASERPRKLSDAVLRDFAFWMNNHYSVSSAAVFLPVGKSALYNWLWRDVCRGSHCKPPRPRKSIVCCAPHRQMSFGVGHYRKRPKDGRFAMMKDAAPIAGRPAIVNARGRFGDWEVDTMYWQKRVMSLSLRERKSGYVRLFLLPNYSANETAKRIIHLLRGLPVHTMTSDGGWEFVRWRKVEKALGIKWYVSDPGRPQQRGGVEQMNGLVRRMVNRDLHRYGLPKALRRAEKILNHRPTPRLQFCTPAQQLGLC